MATIGSWWVANHDAAPDETVRTSFYANRLRRDRRPLGGKLYVTDRRIVFCPHLLDALLGGEPTSWELAALEAADAVEPPTSEDDPYGAGQADRLALEVQDGEPEYFVIGDIDAAVGAILNAVTENTAR